MAGESLHGGPERPLSKAMKMKPGFCWKLQDVGGTKAVGCLPGRATYRERNQPESSQQNWKGRAIRHRAAGFCVCFAGCPSCFGPVFPHYAPIPPFFLGW